MRWTRLFEEKLKQAAELTGAAYLVMGEPLPYGPAPSQEITVRAPELTPAFKAATVQRINISDWKNYQTVQGDVIEIIVDIDPVISSLLKGGAIITTPVLNWMSRYKWNPSGFLVTFIENVLNYSTEIGMMKSKIEFDRTQTKLASDYSYIRVVFKVISNAWPLVFVCTAILGVGAFTYLSIREVNKIIGDPGVPGLIETAGKSVTGLVTIILLVIGFMFLNKK